MSFGNASVALFVDNLFDSRTITNYQLGQLDYNIPVDANNNYLWAQPTPQRNSYTFRPRTIGLTFTYRM